MRNELLLKFPDLKPFFHRSLSKKVMARKAGPLLYIGAFFDRVQINQNFLDRVLTRNTTDWEALNIFRTVWECLWAVSLVFMRSGDPIVPSITRFQHPMVTRPSQIP